MKKILFSIIAIFITQIITAQNSYYIAPQGQNTNDGSRNSPWQSIQYGCNQLAAGDTLHILAGTYAAKILLTVSGQPNQRIIIKNYRNDTVIIDGSNLSAGEYMMSLKNVDYISIIGLHFQDYQALDAIGIEIINSSYISILNNQFSNIDYSANALGQRPNASQNSQPIIVFGRDPNRAVKQLKINNNQIFNCEVGYSECISINGNIDTFEVINNHIHHNTNIAIAAIGFEGECSDFSLDQARNGLIKKNKIHHNPSAYTPAAGIYVDGGKYIVVENNSCYQNDYGIEIGCENNGNAPNNPSASHVVVRNNLIYNNLITGIALGGFDYPTSGKVEYTTITNNTCYHNDKNNSYNGEMLITYVENSKIENNIFYANNSNNVCFVTDNPTPSLTFNYNIYYSLSGHSNIDINLDGTSYSSFSAYQNASSQDANSTFVQPLFRDLANLDFHLTTASPAIDVGNPNFVAVLGEVDMDNKNRIYNSRVDCGADEYDTTLGFYSLPLPSINLYPNPVLDWLMIPNDFVYYQMVAMNGQVLKEGSVTSSAIDLSSLDSGIYFIYLTDSNNHHYNTKIIKI